MARGKRGAVVLDPDCADDLVIVDLLQRAMQFGDQAFRQAVARRRPVEREQGDGACVFAQQDRRLRR